MIVALISIHCLAVDFLKQIYIYILPFQLNISVSFELSQSAPLIFLSPCIDQKGNIYIEMNGFNFSIKISKELPRSPSYIYI
jgi:hypothetical protein